MAHFRGTMVGSRGETSRLGTKSSGLKSRLASWDGAVEIELRYEPSTGKNLCIVTQTQHHGAGCYQEIARFEIGKLTA